MEGGQRFTTPPPNLTAPSCPGGGSAAQGNRRPRAGCLLPHGASPTPNPSGAPAPTHPGAGVGGCRVGSRSNRRGSSAPRTSWLLKARSRPSYLRRSEPRAPHPAPRAREEAEAGSRGPRRRRAPSSAGKRPAAAGRAAPPRRRSLSRSLPGSVRSCVCLSVGPSLRRRRRSSPGSAARSLPASPLRSRARGLAGSLARALPPPLLAPRGEEPGGPPAAWRGPSPEGGGGGGAARAGRRGESGGGGEAAPSSPYRFPAAERLQAGLESSGPPGSEGRDEDPEARRGRVPRARAC